MLDISTGWAVIWFLGLVALWVVLMALLTDQYGTRHRYKSWKAGLLDTRCGCGRFKMPDEDENYVMLDGSEHGADRCKPSPYMTDPL